MKAQAATVAVVRRYGDRLPTPLLHSWLRWAVAEREVALCLHRVGIAGDAASVLACPAEVLDEVVARARHIGGRRRWLSLTFDDGYPDALAYVAARAPRHREIGWRVFVCPDKAVSQSGFRWDAGLDALDDLPTTAAGLAAENGRRELREAGRRAASRVANSAEVRALQAVLPGVVGNHTNSHLPLARLAPEVARAELEASLASFETTFGPCQSFAFPFGGAGDHWCDDHAELLRDHGVGELWAVASHTFSAADRCRGAVLPRFPVDGRDSAKTVLALVGLSATVERARGLAGRVRGRATTRNAVHSGTGAASPGGVPTGVVPTVAGCGYVHGEPLVPLGGLSGLSGPAADADPFVLLHGASGHVENFRPLAARLADRAPVYGVRAIGVLASETPPATVAEAVDIAVDAIKQLGRPVRLVGYSLGGVFALQVANALQGADLLAGPVTLIDTYDTALELLPLKARLANARTFARTYGPWTLQRWARRLVERQVRGVLHRPQAAQPWRAQLGFGDVTALGLVDIEPHIRQITAGLAGLEPHTGPVRALRSAELAPNLPLDAGIGHLLGEVPAVELLAGDHFSLFTAPYVDGLAALLS